VLYKSICHCIVSGDFNKNLVALLVKIFVQRLPQWKDDATNNLGNEKYLLQLFIIFLQ